MAIHSRDAVGDTIGVVVTLKFYVTHVFAL
jgi:hypothetical protein